jgi:hypothetical protein
MDREFKEVVIADVETGELPRAWAASAGLARGQRVDVVIRPSRRAAAGGIAALTRRASAAARKKGFTPSRLARILDEARAARRR